MQWKWYYKKGYAIRNSKYIRGQKRHVVYMHREICKPKNPSNDIDHINGNLFGDYVDNRRKNLREASRSENARNSKKKSKASSKYKGVSYFKHVNRWNCHISNNGKIEHYPFESEILAANYYNHLAKEYFGEFARLNVLSENEYISKENCEKQMFKRVESVSGYFGVGWYKNYGMWVVRISVNDNRKCIGYFKSKPEAAVQYNQYLIDNGLVGYRSRSNVPSKKLNILSKEDLVSLSDELKSLYSKQLIHSKNIVKNK